MRLTGPPTPMALTNPSLVTCVAIFRGETYRWVKEVGNAMPFTAWDALVRNPAIPAPPVKYPETSTEAWIVLATWSLAAVLVTIGVIHHRDL